MSRKITGCEYPVLGLSSMKPRLLFTILLLAVSLGWLFSVAPSSAHTEQDESLPDIGVDEKLGAQLPLDLTFTNQDGKTVRLGDYFAGRPVILLELAGSVAEVADSMKLSEGAVKYHLHAARQTLRGALEAQS